MKTERRHELQSNELVHLLAQYHSQVKPYLRWILAAVLFVAVVWMAYGWMGFSRQRQMHAGWTEFLRASKARDLDGLRQVATQFPRTPAAARALFMAGTIGLHSGAGRLIFDRAEGLDQLDQARKDFEAAIASPGQDSYLTAQALLGLAQVREARNELEQATKVYQQIVNEFPDSTFAITARQRLDFLKLPDTVSFSDWFTKQHVDRPQGAATSSISPQIPTIHDDLPITSDFMLPDVNALQRSAPGGDDLGPLIPPDEGSEPAEPPAETAPPVDSGVPAESETAPSEQPNKPPGDAAREASPPDTSQNDDAARD